MQKDSTYNKLKYRETTGYSSCENEYRCEFAEQISAIEEMLGEAVYEESVIRAESDGSVIDVE